MKPSLLRLHLEEPDFTRPALEIPNRSQRSMIRKLTFLYGKERAVHCYMEIERLMRVYYAHKTLEMIDDDRAFVPANRFTEKDIILITYGDAIYFPDQKPLQALSHVLNGMLRGMINTVHILPFFPSSSDRGFAIKSFFDVDPRLGTWDDFNELGMGFKLMFDGVVNHVSSKSRWFQEFLNGNPEYQDYFITFSTQDAIQHDHLNLILRPRTSPLLTRFQTLDGPKYLWTTFSPDQIDLNYKNERVLLRIVEVLLHYVRRGANLIRLDAVTYIWHELGTTCALLQESHTIVQLLRAILDVVAPQVSLVTESNVPHKDNISYFGNGINEAQMVYNFALPPLTLHAFLKGSCRRLANWAASLQPVSPTTTFFNFLDSHDGVGLLPVADILPSEEIDFLIRQTLDHGGLVSYRDSKDGTRAPYELNITWFNALNGVNSRESLDLRVARFVASRAIALAIRGVPGIYLHSLVGGRNYQAAVRKTGEARNINRRILSGLQLKQRLHDPTTAFYKTAKKLFSLMEKRTQHPAFHPNGPQRIIPDSDAVFAVLRYSPDKSQCLLALTNVTKKKQELNLALQTLGRKETVWRDLLGPRVQRASKGRLVIPLRPYEVLWLRPVESVRSVKCEV